MEIEVFHFGKDDFPDNLSTYMSHTYRAKGIDPRRLAASLTDKHQNHFTIWTGDFALKTFHRYERYFDRKALCRSWL